MDTFYQGRRGAGKTLMAVIDTLLDLCCKKEIWTNTPLHKDFNAKYFEYPEDLLNAFENGNFSDTPKTILLDEIDKWANSRRSQTQVNIDFVNAISQARKHDMKIIYTSQFLGGYDKNLRALTDIIVRCVPVIDYTDLGLGTIDYPEPAIFEYTVVDLNQWKITNKYRISRKLGRYIYPLYKTKKVVVSA